MPQGMQVRARLCPPDIDVFRTCLWDRSDVEIRGSDGKATFQQSNVSFPSYFSPVSRQIVAGKYFRGALDSPDREHSLPQVIERVVGTIAGWGTRAGYFATPEDGAQFVQELSYLMLHQYACFNSPVLFNFGVPDVAQQGAACFILEATDTIDGWSRLAAEEARIFKWGSGAGFSLSPIRSSWDYLSGGGRPSGPLSLMQILDVQAGQIKSGGKTRRAAKMHVLDAWHPDILRTRDGQPGFVGCKLDQERAARALIAAGYDAGFNVPGGAYSRVFFQNANHSVRAGGEFFQEVAANGPWCLLDRFGVPVHTMPARALHRAIAEAAWASGDPAYQYRSQIARWHTLPNTGEITASNPCAEYLSLNNTSCNLFSVRLTKFRMADGSFDVGTFEHACEILTLAGEIIVGSADYPTDRIAEETARCRNLGLGYCDLGALLMRMGLPYDSPGARDLAGAITSLMAATAYAKSAEIARDCGGPFAYFEANRAPMLRVVQQHRAENTALVEGYAWHEVGRIGGRAGELWERALRLGEKHGFRNSQTTVIAPTGTISFFMGADTTGIEPDISLLKEKQLAGGGKVAWMSDSVQGALLALGYEQSERVAIYEELREVGHLEHSRHLKPAHLPVFDCAFPPMGGERSIPHMGHLRMMAAVQPFVSGAISKTVNMPASATVEDVESVFLQGEALGLKCVTIYRDGCKGSQPLSAGSGTGSLACPQCGKPVAKGTTEKCLTCGNCGYQVGCSV